MQTEDQIIRETAAELLMELETENLEVILIPAPEPMHFNHCIRVAASHNPVWYRNLFEEYLPKKLDNRRLKSALKKFAAGVGEPDRVYGGIANKAILNRIEQNKEVPF